MPTLKSSLIAVTQDFVVVLMFLWEDNKTLITASRAFEHPTFNVTGYYIRETNMPSCLNLNKNKLQYSSTWITEFDETLIKSW